MSKTPEPWTEAELRDQFACYEDKDHPWTLDRYNQYGEYFDRAIAKIKAEAWDEAKNAVLRGIPYWHTDDGHHGFDIWEDEDGVAQEGGARIEVKKILDANPYKEAKHEQDTSNP